MATDGTLVLFGDSEDAGLGHPLKNAPESAAAFFEPGTPDTFGRMHLGWLWQGTLRSYQAGMNEHGHAYGVAGVARRELTSYPQRPYDFANTPYIDLVLAKNKTVGEVIEYTLQFNVEELWFQIMFADANGDAVVIGPGPDGELAFTRKEASGQVFVATSSINVADSNPGLLGGRDPATRVDDATTILDGIIEEDDALCFDTFEEALEVVHRQGAFGIGGSYTMYSTTYDLTHQTANIYFLSQFDEAAEIDLAVELEKGSRAVFLTNLFSDALQERALDQYWGKEPMSHVILAAEIAGAMAFLGLVAYWLGGLVLNLLR